MWLTEMDLQLTNVEHFSESNLDDKMRQLNVRIVSNFFDIAVTIMSVHENTCPYLWFNFSTASHLSIALH